MSNKNKPPQLPPPPEEEPTIHIEDLNPEPMPDFESVVEVQGSSTTDGGFFPLEVGNCIIGNVLRLDKIAGQYGEKTTIKAEGQTMEVNLQTVYIIRGTARLRTPAGLATVSGLYKVAQVSRLVTALAPYLADPRRICRIEYLGQEGEKVKKRTGETRDGAHLFDVREMRRTVRVDPGAVASHPIGVAPKLSATQEAPKLSAPARDVDVS